MLISTSYWLCQAAILQFNPLHWFESLHVFHLIIALKLRAKSIIILNTLRGIITHLRGVLDLFRCSITFIREFRWEVCMRFSINLTTHNSGGDS